MDTDDADISWTEFYLAIRSGDTAKVKRCLVTKDFRVYISSNDNALSLAAMYGHKDMIIQIMSSLLWQELPLREKQRHVRELILSAMLGPDNTHGNLELLTWLLEYCKSDLPTDRTDLFDIYECATCLKIEYVEVLRTIVSDDFHHKPRLLLQAVQKGNEILRFYMQEADLVPSEVAEIAGCTLLDIGCALNDKRIVAKQLFIEETQWWIENTSPPVVRKEEICPFKICCATGNLECLELLVADFILRDIPEHRLANILNDNMYNVIRWNRMDIAKYLIKEKLVNVQLPHLWFDNIFPIVRTQTFDYLWKLAKKKKCIPKVDTIKFMLSVTCSSVLEYFESILDTKTLDWNHLQHFVRSYITDGDGSVDMLLRFIQMMPQLGKEKMRRGIKEKSCSAREQPSRRASVRNNPPELSSKYAFYHESTSVFECGACDWVTRRRLPNPVLVEIVMDILPPSLRCPCGLFQPMSNFLDRYDDDFFRLSDDEDENDDDDDDDVDDEDEGETTRPFSREEEPLELKVKHARAIFSLLAAKGLRPRRKQVMWMIRSNIADLHPQSLHLSRLLCLAETYDLLTVTSVFCGRLRIDSLLWFEVLYPHRDEFLTKLFITFCGSSTSGYDTRARIHWDGMIAYLNSATQRREHFVNLFHECHVSVEDNLSHPDIPNNTVSLWFSCDNQLHSLQSMCRYQIRQRLRKKCDQMNIPTNTNLTTINDLVDSLCDEQGVPTLLRDFLHFQWFVDDVEKFRHLPAKGLCDVIEANHPSVDLYADGTDDPPDIYCPPDDDDFIMA